jgi:probable HAF family extracellular repeat protein
MVDLGVFPGIPTSVMPSSIAMGVSADGLLVAGTSASPQGGGRAFRWSQAGGMLNLGLIGTAVGATGLGISADGMHICGKVGSPSFRWTENGAGGGTMEAIAPLPGLTSSWAQGISGDGRVVVGYCSDTNGSNRAFRWITNGTEAGGGTLHAISAPQLQGLNYAYATNSSGSDKVSAEPRKSSFGMTRPGGTLPVSMKIDFCMTTVTRT